MSSSSKKKAEKPDIRDSLAKLQTKQSKATSSSKASSTKQPIEISDDDDSRSPDSPQIGRKLDKLALQSDTDMMSVKSTSTYASKGKGAATGSSAAANRKRKATVIDSDEDEEEEEEDDAPPRKKAAISTKHSSNAKKPATSTAGKKAKNVLVLSDSSSDDPKPVKKPAPKKDAVPRASGSTTKASKASSARDDSVSPSKPAKPNFAAILAKRASGPAAPGSKEIPIGQPNCLANLAFVFTGELDSLSREEAQDLAKRYGGRVTTAPSSKTSFVVLGNNAGPSKLSMIEKHNLKTLSEDQFLDLIRTRKGVLDEKALDKLRKEEEKIKKDAEEMEKKEKEQKKAMATKPGSKREQHSFDPSSQLWTTKYAPQNLSQICGNKANVEKVQLWLHDWPQSRKSGFKYGGKNAINGYRALLIYGPPGIGKTTTAHLCAKLEGFTPIELNASDARSKKLIEACRHPNATNINNTSLDGWMSHGQVNSAGIEITDRTVLIMDEVDGMSAGDRGGVVALKALIKKTQVPIICIANDGQAQKLKPLMGIAASIHFTKPTAAQIKSRIASICYKEKLNIPPNVIEQLIAGAQSDIRQVLNMLSTWKLSKGSMDFDESKRLSEANQKYTILSPFNCTSKILGPYTFSKTNRETLGEKMDYYFHEPALMPLFVQENYLKQKPARASDSMGQEYNLKVLELMRKASASISDGDMVDQMIRGSEQHWSLMPLHACLSFVRPASFMYGVSGEGYGYKDSASFPQWLGQNSKQTKLQRQLGDIQVKMRMKVSGDKSEIRRHYIPALFPRIVQPLTDKDLDAKETIKEVIGVMDEYYLNKEDWDTIVELGVGSRKDTDVLKNVATATKTAFTRTYNASDHPIAFHKGTDVGGIKKIAAKDVPDVEEAFDIDDEVPEDDEDGTPETEKTAVLNDKLIKEKKPKGSGEPKGKGKAK
ncbi:related to replication factor C protein [Serendipita indica DSM 11827]|uniref:Replication factor C subunit 1 n=1 Tax=Serendipita indica (strain DSM 11827) TaxID=1109443 RepID=G4TBJ1_SERID|nr:related to replication factor C protein [Serendipita indica DSM 11827]